MLSRIPESEDNEELDSLPALSGDEERAPKQRRARDRDPQALAAETAEDDVWQQGLGAVGKKIARRGLLAKRTVQQLEARQTGQGGKAKGKEATVLTTGYAARAHTKGPTWLLSCKKQEYESHASAQRQQQQKPFSRTKQE